MTSKNTYRRSPIKILFLTNGGSQFDRRVIEELRDRGYQVWYVYLRKAGHQNRIPGVESVYLGYEVTRSEGLLSFRILHRLRAYWRFRRLLKELRPDILHAGWIQGPGLMAAVSGYHPFVLMPWGSDILLFPQRSRAFHKITTYTLNRADGVYCDAQLVRERIKTFKDFDDDRIVVFPCAANLEIFQRKQEARDAIRAELGWQDNPILIMTRNLEHIYGIESFLESLPFLLESVPEARVLILGSGSLADKAQNFISSLGLGEKVRMLGRVPNVRIPEYLSAADLYVSNSISDGTSMSLIEAMACSLPVVVTDIPANKEWVVDGVNGRLVGTNDPNALASTMIQLLADEETRKQYANRNLEIAQNRANWKVNFGKLEELYTNVLDL